MSQPIKVLVVEDSENDALLLLRDLRKQGFEPTHRRVQDPGALTAALEKESWDLVLSDYSMPGFTGLDALRVVQEKGLDLPFIVISGTVGETVAVETMKAGAHDYLMKGQLGRLGEAIRRELEAATIRRERRLAEEQLRHLNAVLRAIRNVNQLIVREKDPGALVRQACECLVETRGYNGAWIALGHEAPTLQAHAGWDGAFEPLARLLERGSWPACRAAALGSEAGLLTRVPADACRECPLAREYGHDLAVVLPLRHQDQQLGLLGVAFPRHLTVNEFERDLLLEVAGDIAFALHDIELERQRNRYAEEQRQSEQARLRALAQTEALLRATRAVLQQPHFDDAARIIFDACAGQIGARAGLVALTAADGEHHEILLLESGGQDCAVDPGQAIPIRGLRAEAYRSGRAVLDNSFAASAHQERLPPGHVALDNVLFAPLLLQGEPVGLIGLANKPGGFTEQDKRTAEAFGEIAAIALRQQRAQTELRRKEERFRGVFQGVSDGILLCDDDGRFVMANDAICRMLGHSEADLLGLRVADIHPPEEVDNVHEAQRQQLAGDISLAPDIPVKRKDGSVFFADINSTPVVIQGRKLLMGCFRDATERRQMQASLAQADRLSSMGMLAAGVAHEINNPLAYVLYNLESLTEDLPRLVDAMRRFQARLDEQLGAERVERIAGDAAREMNPALLADIADRFADALEGTRRIRNIARGLGTFSRVERDEVVPVNLMHVIEVALNMAFNEIKYRARLVKDYGKAPPVMASEGRLSQVFLNLLINAAHAIDEGDVENNVIKIRTWAEGGMVCAEVHDTGKGILPEHIDRLFEPFFTTKKIGVGSGLGLPISKNIVESYGGTIEVRSRPGEGTSFTVRLPLRAEQTDAVPTQPEADAAEAAAGRILVIDDEDGIRSAMVRMLRGHEVLQAATGEEAKQLLEQDQAFDLILCDMMMPDLSGMDLHQWLAETHPRLARQLIFITGGAFTPRAREYLSHVDNIRLEKPFDVKNFKKIVGELVRTARTPEQDRSC